MTTSSRAAVTWSSGSSSLPVAGVLADQHLAQPTLDAQVLDRRTDRVLGQVEQLPRHLVDQGDPVLGIQCDHALRDAAQHRLAVLGEPGDLARLHPASLALDPAGEEPGPAQPDGERDARGR